MNGDGWIDLVVSRRKGSSFWSTIPTVAPNNETDTVWLNDQVGPDYFNGIAPIKLAVDSAVESFSQTPPPANVQYDVSESFGLEGASLNGVTSYQGGPPKRTIDFVVVGAFGIRYYSGNGDGHFTHVATDTDPGSGIGAYRNVTYGDLDGDGDTDMFVTRGGSASDRVWFNNGAGVVAPNPQFTMSNEVIVRPPSLGIEWRLASGCAAVSGAPTCGNCLSSFDAGSLDAAVGDLDNDGDLDLVIACPSAQNAAYLNDSHGNFGTVVGSSGSPNWYFQTPTSDWPLAEPNDGHPFHSSWFLYELCYKAGLSAWFHHYDDQVSPGPAESCFEFHVPGKILDYSSAPWIDDFDGDGKYDVVFANRNDIEDTCKGNLVSLPLPPGSENPPAGTVFWYLNKDYPAPVVYNHIYFNNSTQTGVLSFWDCVETVGMGNEGTSYIETAAMGGTAQKDWIESNFSNRWVNDLIGVSQQYSVENTHLFFGQPSPPPGTCGVGQH